ncbi:hypothetical protein BJ508DRAFT_320550 [Ascobolus immersus RN42]|uniref:F-box domain-containing protein n=1 Tax=Ascobolus immersus RN42 TaxID=1160509 RepID=A0A3N4ITM6_ASCIM|nr:hypothetical protein BJ508DRAFT_320550 [Ascobolus immersus RN42]
MPNPDEIRARGVQQAKETGMRLMSAFRSIKNSQVVEQARAVLPHQLRRSSVYTHGQTDNRRNTLSIRPLRLPAEIWISIFSELGPGDITNLQLACRNFRLLISFNQEAIVRGILSNTPELQQLSLLFPRVKKKDEDDEEAGKGKGSGGIGNGTGPGQTSPPRPAPERRDTGTPPLHKLYYIQYLHGLNHHRQICKGVAWYLAQAHINSVIPPSAPAHVRSQRTDIIKAFHLYLIPRLFALHAFLTHLQLRLNFLLASAALSTYNPSSSLVLPPDCSFDIQRELLQSPTFTTAELVKTHHIYMFLMKALQSSLQSPNTVQTEKYIFAILSHRGGLQGALEFFTADDLEHTQDRRVRVKYMKEMSKRLEKVLDGTRANQVWFVEAAKEMARRGVGNGNGLHRKEHGWGVGSPAEWIPQCSWCFQP